METKNKLKDLIYLPDKNLFGLIGISYLNKKNQMSWEILIEKNN
jgi:hypothetical protein